MCQTMPMSEKSKNVRNRRVADVALVSHGLGRRMRDHLSARAEMSALSQMDVFRGRTTLPAWVFAIIVVSEPKDPAHGRRRVSALVDCDGARLSRCSRTATIRTLYGREVIGRPDES
jgi:hypothetical protein